MCQRVSWCSSELNRNRARGGNHVHSITFASISSGVSLKPIVLVYTFHITRFTILCHGLRRCVASAPTLQPAYLIQPARTPSLRLGRVLAYTPYQETTTAAIAPVHITDGPPVVRLPRVRFPRETEYPPQLTFDPIYVVRLPEPETSILNRQGSVGPPLDTIVCIPRHTGAQWACSDRTAEIVQLFIFSAVEIFPDVLWHRNGKKTTLKLPGPLYMFPRASLYPLWILTPPPSRALLLMCPILETNLFIPHILQQLISTIPYPQ